VGWSVGGCPTWAKSSYQRRSRRASKNSNSKNAVHATLRAKPQTTEATGKAVRNHDMAHACGPLILHCTQSSCAMRQSGNFGFRTIAGIHLFHFAAGCRRADPAAAVLPLYDWNHSGGESLGAGDRGYARHVVDASNHLHGNAASAWNTGGGLLRSRCVE
jgi:hypothetical protein